ncbi:hypothetical protein E2C01_067900 [Portunus trituberculatus]|uniref:Uncharacterized protein n=1 Tax=Portunus trituberculatus TaxID=210409 RepID=A0A5B7HV32_PORTR|nr:hypothetical protein [Portunus trituberculatus]
MDSGVSMLPLFYDNYHTKVVMRPRPKITCKRWREASNEGTEVLVELILGNDSLHRRQLDDDEGGGETFPWGKGRQAEEKEVVVVRVVQSVCWQSVWSRAMTGWLTTSSSGNRKLSSGCIPVDRDYKDVIYKGRLTIYWLGINISRVDGKYTPQNRFFFFLCAHTPWNPKALAADLSKRNCTVEKHQKSVIMWL